MKIVWWEYKNIVEKPWVLIATQTSHSRGILVKINSTRENQGQIKLSHVHWLQIKIFKTHLILEKGFLGDPIIVSITTVNKKRRTRSKN